MAEALEALEALAALALKLHALEGAQDGLADLDPNTQADTIALLQDLRQRLGLVESFTSTAMGKSAGAIQGNLSDGRQFTLKRTQDRKEWDHDEWKRDARRAITNQLDGRFLAQDDLIDTTTGEAVPLGRVIQEAMLAIQNVHGSANPKSTALKPLGLYAGDYCTSTPGGWKLNAIRLDPKPDTTTTKD